MDSGKTVLLVSDDPTFFEEPENVFQSRGVDVFTAMTGAEAIEHLSEHGADLTICSGIPADVAAKQLAKALDGTSLILLLTGGESAGAWERIPECHVVTTPVQGRELLKLSSKVLDVLDRKYISILVQVRVSRPKATTIFGKSKDLSATGILVETSQTLMLHDQVVVSFLIPGADRMVQSDALVMREVVRAGGQRRYGLKFLSLPDEDQEIVHEFLGGQLAQ